MRLLTPDERQAQLQSGMHVVDLGAAPGGWTWQFVRRNMHVIAVDNGNMQSKLLDTGLVEHIREDGFSYQPTEAIDWMVCDIIDHPQRVVERVAQWLTSRWCKQSIFNLKLPMKQRYQQTQKYLEYLTQELEHNGMRYRIACKQLYHDREEVTVYVRTLP